MEIIEPRRLYQQLAAELKTRIEQGVYLVGDKLPAERFIADEKNVSRTVVREAIIMLEVEGYVEVRKGSGIHVISNHPKYQQVADESLEFANYGPFELLQARQLIESNIAEFAATQVTKQDIMKLMEIQEKARNEKCFLSRLFSSATGSVRHNAMSCNFRCAIYSRMFSGFSCIHSVARCFSASVAFPAIYFCNNSGFIF